MPDPFNPHLFMLWLPKKFSAVAEGELAISNYPLALFDDV